MSPNLSHIQNSWLAAYDKACIQVPCPLIGFDIMIPCFCRSRRRYRYTIYSDPAEGQVI